MHSHADLGDMDCNLEMKKKVQDGDGKDVVNMYVSRNVTSFVSFSYVNTYRKLFILFG